MCVTGSVEERREKTMKNFKRLVAGTIAATMALALSVSAFAAEPTITATSTDTTYFNEYADGALTLKSGALTQEGQLTVVIIDAEKANATLTGDDLYYINQGTNGETFWTTGMGTKVDLTTLVNETTTSKEFIVRIGGTNLQNVIEVPLTVTYNAATPDTPTYMLGDVNDDTSIDMGDAAAILNHFMEYTLITDATAKLAADVNVDKSIDMGDAAAILNHFMEYTLIVQPK
jgi:hypothetical protein